MSSFKIIQLSPVPLEEYELMDHVDIDDDPLLNSISDGWEEDDRKHGLQDAFYALKEIGTVNRKSRTFSFFGKEKIKKRYAESMERVFMLWRNKMNAGKAGLAEYQLRTFSREACEIDALFYYQDRLHGASCLIADYLDGTLPSTLHVGSVFDAHR